MSTIIYFHPACLEHDTGQGHPERADRLRAVKAALEAPEFAGLEWREPPEARRDQLLLAHPESHVDRIMDAIPSDGLVSLDADTLLSAGSGGAALRAAGAGCAAVDAVISGEADNAFCAVRPPGHHAEAVTPMGFCLFNSAAIAAQHARRAHGLHKVAVVDFDVHHGNGTQDIFFQDPGLFYASTHESPLYPGTGAADERGVADNIVNVPLPGYADGSALQIAFEGRLLPALERFGPELIIISAGFDAHAADPLATLCFEEEDFTWVTEQLVQAAAKLCGGRLISTLEGGYDLQALASSSAAHVRALMAA